MAAFATLVCQRNCVFLCKGTKLQKAVLFAIVCRFFVAQSFYRCTELSPTGAQSFLPPVHRAQHLLHRAPPNDAELLPCGTQGSSPLQPPSRLMIHRAFSLGAQSFFPWNTELLPSGAQSFAFAVFATLICQINSVFPCKDTKAQEFGLCRSLGRVMPVFCGTELFPPVHRAFSLGAQSFFPPVHRAFSLRYTELFIYFLP